MCQRSGMTCLSTVVRQLLSIVLNATLNANYFTPCTLITPSNSRLLRLRFHFFAWTYRRVTNWFWLIDWLIGWKMVFKIVCVAVQMWNYKLPSIIWNDSWTDSHLFITALSSVSRKTRGRALPSCGSGVTDPTSTKPKPSFSIPSTASPCLSNPAAKPIGLRKFRFHTRHF